MFDRQTEEFVISVPPAGMAGLVMKTASHYPPDINEFEVSGLGTRPVDGVSIPRVEGCLAWMSCRFVRQYVEKEYVLIVGRVLSLEISESVFDSEQGFDPEKADPLLACLNRRGINFTTIRKTGHFEGYGAMFPDGKDPLAHLYEQ